MMPRRLGLLSIGALGLALSACATGPAYPLMTPIQVAHDFGYDQRPAGAANRFEVTYLTPPATAYGYRFDLRPAEGQAKDMAADLAMLHAARLAQASGWQGFEINDRHSSTDAENYGADWDDGWGDGWHRGWHHHGYGWGDGPYMPPQQVLQAEVSLTITFTNTIKPGDYQAADVIQQVIKTYPGAEGAPGAPGTPPPPAPPAATPAPVKPTA
jgi:hypothetical protein